MRVSYFLLLPLALGLAACDKAEPIAQQAASAVVAETLKQAGSQAQQVLDKAKNDANETLAGMGIDASAAVDSLKEKARNALKEQAATLNGNDWRSLEQFVGKYPRDVGLYTDVSPIAPELKRLLGSRFETFKEWMATQGPLQREQGVLYATGNKQHAAGDGSAYLLIDVARRQLEVGMMSKGKLVVYASAGDAIYKPKDVETIIQNMAGR
ncbi:hypothetical protein [Jeongeupia sp. USM3]|uniref:hypothetical protein n=1 Tax=Jeongeupia sp. USM3 TaxID=1906741 RepID=UPI00089E0202|nr:hypothetical protein [Jeongeupia sp. USM3]AOX99719.1 hypothetical protein BJP62_04165 [Jeongeupia sp. USM3]